MRACCPTRHRRRSGGLAVVEVQHPAQPRPARNLAARLYPTRRAQRPLDQLPAKPLMKAFPMIVGHEFLDDVSEMSLAEKDEVIQALASDGFHKPLRMRVAVRALRRNPHALHPSLPQDCFERLREKRIAVVDQMRRISKEPVDRVGQVSRHLLHPFPVGVRGDAGDLHRTRLDRDDEEQCSESFRSDRAPRH